MQHRQRPIRALALRLGGVALISTMFMLGKYAGQEGIALPEIMFWRQAVTLPVLLAWLIPFGGFDRLRTRRIAAHAGRAVVGMCGMLCGFASAILLPLAESTTLGFTSPLFVVLLSAVLLRERVGRWRWAAVVLGFAGVLIIAQPGHEPLPVLGAAAGLTAGLIIAIISFQIRDLGRTEEPISIVFYFALFGTLITAPFLPLYAGAHTGWQWTILIATGLAGTLGQILITAALRHGAVASVIVMDYSALFWATLYGWLVWDKLPPLATWLGAPAIIAAGMIVAWREQRLARGVGPASPIAVE